jgi:2-aminomuconate deaminase
MSKSIILQTNAPGLANYPHAKQVGSTLYISGISSRNPDNKSWKGVHSLEDGSLRLDIREQTRAVIEKYPMC